MPAQYDLPAYQGLEDVEDVNKYNKLPFWLAMLEARMFPVWSTYNSLFGTVSWKPNMGTTMRGVRAEHSPVGQAQFFPNDITSYPNKNVYETLETSEDATIKLHDFESKLFHFLPSFQDFRENQLQFNHRDIVRQMAVSNELFIRTYSVEKCPFIYVSGKLTPLVSAPANPNTAFDSTTVYKNQAWWAARVAEVQGNLSLKALDHMVAVMRDDVGAPFFEGTVNTPNDNELVKGRYCFIGSSEAYQQLKWDPDFNTMRNVNLSIVNNGFRGNIFDELTYKTERYPLRIASDGSIPAPEIVNAGDNRTRPNPDYIDAEFELGHLVGADAFKTIRVGPPPREFANKKMSAEKFYKLRWNGEIQLTDQVLVKYSDGSYGTNSKGRFLRLEGSQAMGIIPQNQYNMMPVLFARKRAGA